VALGLFSTYLNVLMFNLIVPSTKNALTRLVTILGLTFQWQFFLELDRVLFRMVLELLVPMKNGKNPEIIIQG
jgi:hypothetical protein